MVVADREKRKNVWRRKKENRQPLKKEREERKDSRFERESKTRCVLYAIFLFYFLSNICNIYISWCVSQFICIVANTWNLFFSRQVTTIPHSRNYYMYPDYIINTSLIKLLLYLFWTTSFRYFRVVLSLFIEFSEPTDFF